MTKLRNAAKGQSCIRCHADDGTVVLAHYSGRYSERFGKGMGRKSHDMAAAHLCQKCHSYFDEYKDGNNDERAIQLMICCILTSMRNYDNGTLK